MLIGWLCWQLWTLQIRVLHLYWLEKTQTFSSCWLSFRKDIKMLMPGRKGHPDKVYSSAALRSALGGMVDSLLFVHAATVCDTTSAVYRKGKCVPFRKTASATSIVYGGASLQWPSSVHKCCSCGRWSVPLCCLWREDRRQLGHQEPPTLLEDHCETESVCEIRLGDSATNVSSCTSTLVPGVPPSTAVAWCRLESYRLGMEAERWTPYTTPYTQRTCTRVATPPHNVQLQIGLWTQLRVSAKRPSMYIDVWILCGTWLQQPRYERWHKWWRRLYEWVWRRRAGRSTSAEKTTTLVADKMKVGGILFYSICQDYRYTICLASANQMKVNNQHYVRAV